MEYIYLKARAKINIALDITGKRDDGYHEIKTVMQSLFLHDVLLIKKIRKENYFKLSCDKPWLPTDSRNLAYKAADYLIKRFNIKTGVFIGLNKTIPIAAGLAGGSSDCAAVLVGMRNLFKLPLNNDELMKIGKNFGADVPYCIMRGTALAEGIGEKLTPLSPIPQIFVLLAKPPFSVSTADVFKDYSPRNVVKRPDLTQLIFYINKKDINGICGELCNVLESVTTVNHPVINDIKTVMLQNGACGSLMSGSGPTVFGLFKNKQTALNACDAVKTNFPEIKDIFVTKTFNNYLH